MNRQNLHSQKGVTLILAVMVLASVSVISFSLSALVLREIKSSRQLIKSEPSISAAEGGGETALFFRMRQITNTAVATVSCPATVSLNLSTGSYNVCNEFYVNPYNFNTTVAEPEIVMLYDPSNPNNLNAGYSSIRVQATGGTTLQMLVKIYDLTEGFGQDDCSGINPTCTTVVKGEPATDITGLNPSKSYAVFLIPQGGPSATASGTVSGNGGAFGIPSKTPNISSIGSKDNVNRRLQILLGQ